MTDIEKLILDGLDKQGVLCQLKAQMRASVYKLIDAQDKQAKGKTDYFWENSKASQLTKNPQLKQMVEIFQEFLQFFNLHYSLSVFKQEINTDSDIKRDNLISKLNIKKMEISQDESMQHYLISFLLNDYFGGTRKTQAPMSFQTKQQNVEEKQQQEVKLQGQEKQQPMKIEQQQQKKIKKEEQKTKFELKPIPDNTKVASSLTGKSLPPLGQLKQQQPKTQEYDFDIGLDDSEDSNKNEVKPTGQPTKFNTFVSPKQQNQNDKKPSFNKVQKEEDNNYEDEISEEIQYDDTFENPSKASGGSSSGLNQNQQPQTNLPQNLQKQVQQQQLNLNQFASSEDYGSQSQGMDLTVDSVKLEEYDLVEPVQLRKKPF